MGQSWPERPIHGQWESAPVARSDGSVVPMRTDNIGNQYVRLSNPVPADADGTATNNQVTATTTSGSTIGIAANAARTGLVITNTGTVNVFISSTSGVTATSGHAIMPGQSLSLGPKLARKAWYLITATSTAVVTWLGEA